jgi:sulfur relay (sulfurtransferase) complex TusBCD TusD component (DsrE family)
MGLLDGLFGTDAADDATADDQEQRQFAILMNAGPDQGATANNGFGYAIDLDDAGHDVRLFLDGTATRWPAEFTENPDRPFNHKWNTIQARGLLVGACGYCADAFGQTESIERANVDLLSGSGEHAPSVSELAEGGYELVTIG